MSTHDAPPELRASTPAEHADIEAIYPQAFPEEDLIPVLRELWQDPEQVLSLVATTESELVGHAVFTRCSLAPEAAAMALLGPVAVRPDHQGAGIGSALIRDGMRRLGEEGAAMVCVLGDPNYYGRFGFESCTAVEPPYTAPKLPVEWEGAWQSIALSEAGKHLQGRLLVPRAWDHEALWLP
jgi:putative acetyltransferase